MTYYNKVIGEMCTVYKAMPDIGIYFIVYRNGDLLTVDYEDIIILPLSAEEALRVLAINEVAP